MIGGFAGKLDAWVVQAGEELHRELIEILKQAKLERDAGALSAESTVKSCEELQERLDKTCGALETLRAGLAAPPPETPSAGPSEEPRAPTETAADPSPPGSTTP
jgi:hypothetical protein